MKTKTFQNMRFFLYVFVFSLIMGSFAFAQDTERKVTVQINKVENGVETMVDTTFTITDENQLHDIMKKLAPDADVNIQMNDAGESGQKHQKRIIIQKGDGEMDDAQLEDQLLNMEENIEIESDGKDVKVHKVIIHKDADGEQMEWISDDAELDDARREEIREMMESHQGEGKKMIMIQLDDEDGEMDAETLEMLKKEGIDLQIEDEDHIVIREGEEGETREVIRTVKVIIRLMDLDDTDKETLQRSGLEPGAMNNDLELADLKFYPNPSKGLFNLNFRSEEKGAAQIEVRDAQGKAVYSESIPDFSGAYEKQLDLSGHASGIYFLTVRVGGKAMSKKLVIE
jgi:hypothetical protein